MAEHTKESGGRRLRVRQRRRYTEEYGDEEELLEGQRAFDVEQKLCSNHFSLESFDNKQDFLIEMSGEELTIAYIQKNGFERPILVRQMKGLGMKIPDQSFNVSKVKECVGSRRILDVMDVQTQRDFTMSMKEWCHYYDHPNRKRLLNVISLEFSHTKLEQFVESPHIVKQVDWIDWVWPKHLKQSQTEGTNSIEDMKYPKVQKYCLMSVKGCYTDFHIDFGGTSVWYHILKGRKVFWLIPPTERNIQLYENWVLSGKQSDIFFGDQVEQCARINLEAGNTFFIPTGWIHAVFTPEDSLVFGGNFLHSFSIEKQLRVAQVEDVTKVPAKFRYPFYTEVLWYVLARYVYCLMHKNHLKCNEDGVIIVKDDPNNEQVKPLLSPSAPAFKSNIHLTPFELSGLKAIIMWLQRLSPSKRSLPELIVSAEALLNDAQILIDDHSKDSHQLAVTGRPVLYWTKKAQTLTDKLRQIKHPSYALKQQLKAKESAVSSPVVRPESPPTRPISSSQYTISSGSTLNQDLIPSSFAGLIAQTGVNHYQPFTPVTQSPILSSIGSSTAPMTPQNGSTPVSLPPVPPLISNNNSAPQPMHGQYQQHTNNGQYQHQNSYQYHSNSYHPPNTYQYPNTYPPPNTMPNAYHHSTNSYQTSNSTQTNYSFAQNQTQYNPNQTYVDKKPINVSVSEPSANPYGHNYTTTGTQSQQTYTNFSTQFSPIKSHVSPQTSESPTKITPNQSMPTQTMGPFPTALPPAVPPSGFHSTPEPYMSNKMVNTSTQSSFPLNPNQKPTTVSTGSGTTPSKSQSNDSSRRRRTRCKKCDSCVRADCGECHFCKDMKKFGGPGRMKQSCIARQCLAPVLPHTACCMICGRDGWEKLTDPNITDETASSLMECSQCWEIVHPFCLNDKFPQLSASDAHLNEDLPNSWECPRCVTTGSKTCTKSHQKLKSTNNTNTTISTSVVSSISQTTPKNKKESEPPEKKPKLEAYDSPPSSDDEEEDKKPSKSSVIAVINEESTDSQSNSSTEGPTSAGNKAYTLTPSTSSSAHVRSCARFPLLTQGLKQMSSQTSNTSNSFTNILPKSNNSSNNTKGEVKGLAALMTHKKKSETSRDRLFKSLKGLKKSSELSSRLSSSCSVKKICKSSINSLTSTSMSTSTSTSTTSSSVMIQNTSSNSSTSSSTSNHSKTSSTAIENKTELNVRDYNDESTDDEIEDVSHLATVDDKSCDITPKRINDSNGDSFVPISDQPMPKRELIQPKYVVRPAPLPCDISSEDETEEESEDETESEEDSNYVNNNRMKRQRMKAIQKYFKKFTKRKNDLTLERDVMVPIMRYLSHKDLHSCMRVCKEWYGFTLEPKFWRHLDLSHKKVNSALLKGIVLRQPRHLNLSWTDINRKQLFWLICRLPQLESLSLVGCSSTAVSALCTVNCPLLAYLDLSWTHSLDDDLMQDLLSAPNDSRPGLMETKTRLRFLSEIRLCGSKISDKTIRLITQNLPFVQRLDFSNCNRITDMGIAVLAQSKSKDLLCLKLSACGNVSDMSFIHLKKCPNILLLDLRECPQVSRLECQRFMTNYPSHTKLVCN